MLVALGFIGYWVFNNVLFPPQQQTGCKAEQDTCIKYCRKTTVHGSPEYQACLKSCDEQAQACR